MTQKKIELQNAEDIFTFFNKYRKSARHRFRGQSDKSWKLVPKAGRLPFSKLKDEIIFGQWKRRAASVVDNRGLNDIELLTVAQHTGLPTRLLDWSYNPLVAVFFACIENYDADGAVYAYAADEEKIMAVVNPFEENEKPFVMLQGSSTHSRISNQFGYFTIHFDPKKEIETDKNHIEKIIIPNDLKKEILFILNQFGINYMTIFPDLDGLSKHLSWFYENHNFWTIPKNSKE